MSSKLVVPVALGLSLVTVTALVLYYVFKKDEEETESKVKTTRINTIEVKVPKSITPVVIGRSGSNIKELERKTGAKLHFKKFTEGEHDICCIMGRSEEAQLAETLIHEYIRNQPEITEDTITVPGWSCGRIIGSGGENINEICHRSGARVRVEGLAGDCSTDRLITIRGTTEQIQKAKELINNYVAQEKCRREVEASKSPRHVPRSGSASPAAGVGAPAVVAPAGVAPAGVAPDDESGDRPHAKYKRAEKAAPSIEVYVSAVSSPSRFWVQFVGPQVAQLDDLVNEMTDYYGRKENREAHALSHVCVGQVVAAVFRHDGRWYRARVHDLRPNEFDPTQTVADVFYLDYGDSEYVATHELCELKSDLLRLRFQAMECFLAGVRPAGGAEAVSPSGQRWDKWHPQAIERFEELTQVARWRALVSRTCTYKNTSTAAGDSDREIPGIELYDVTDEGELDIGAVLVSEGWAIAGAAPDPAPLAGHVAPFGDLGKSSVLGMLEPGRSSSVPRDHRDTGEACDNNNIHTAENDVLSASKSLSSKHSDKVLSVSNLDLSYPKQNQPQTNGTHEFFDIERQTLDKEGSSETLTPEHPHTAIPPDFKANMNRIDSHHSNLEALASSTYDLHK